MCWEWEAKETEEGEGEHMSEPWCWVTGQVRGPHHWNSLAKFCRASYGAHREKDKHNAARPGGVAAQQGEPCEGGCTYLLGCGLILLQALVQEEILNILRERLVTCARKEGPFARKNCKDVIDAYRNAFNSSKTVSESDAPPFSFLSFFNSSKTVRADVPLPHSFVRAMPPLPPRRLPPSFVCSSPCLAPQAKVNSSRLLTGAAAAALEEDHH